MTFKNFCCTVPLCEKTRAIALALSGLTADKQAGWLAGRQTK